MFENAGAPAPERSLAVLKAGQELKTIPVVVLITSAAPDDVSAGAHGRASLTAARRSPVAHQALTSGSPVAHKSLATRRRMPPITR